MRHLTLALIVGLLTLPSRAGEPADEPTDKWKPPLVKPPVWPDAIRARNAEMKRRVDTWLAKGRPARMPLHIVYLTCSDQKPFADHRQRLNRVMTEVQHWFRVQHKAAGFGAVTFALERDAAGLVKLNEAEMPFTVKSRTSGNRTQTHRASVKAAKAALAKAGASYDRSFVLVLTTIPDDHGAAPFYGMMIPDRGYCFAVDTPWLDSKFIAGRAVGHGGRVSCEGWRPDRGRTHGHAVHG